MNIEKRLKAIETLYAPKQDYCSANILLDGSVKVYHSELGKFRFKNRKELDQFIDENNIDRSYMIIVERVIAD